MKRHRTLERLRASDIERLPPGDHHDGGGLFLRVEGEGRRWVLRLSMHGKRLWRGLGPYPTISLQMARDAAIDRRRAARLGKDLVSHAQTFRQAFERHFAQRREGLRNEKHISQWRTGLETHAFPVIGDGPVAEVSHDDIVAILRPIWQTTPETARRILQRLSIIFDIATSPGRR
jgi:hypothetical protein